MKKFPLAYLYLITKMRLKNFITMLLNSLKKRYAGAERDESQLRKLNNGLIDTWTYSIILKQNWYIAAIMGYAKERGKLEKLLAKTVGIEIYDEKNLTILTDIHEQYSHTVRILKNKEPETFTDLYKNELQEVKDGKKAVRESDSEEARQANFILYVNSIQSALEKTIKATIDSL